MTKFYAVRDRTKGDRYAVIALSDIRRPGYTRAYRWVPNFKAWVLDRALLRDFRSRDVDQANEFDPMDPADALQLAHDLPPVRARWVLDAYRGEDERLSSADLGAPVADQSRPTTDPHLADTVRKTPPGTWIPVRTFPRTKSTAARKWVSEVRLGKKARLQPLGPLEARLETEEDIITAYLRRPESSGSIVATAKSIAEAAHQGQQDKAGHPYITHPGRVASRLETAGAPAEAIAAGWLHDVVEDTDVTLDDLHTAGLPPETVQAVDAVTKRQGEPAADYATRIKTTPLALEVKCADLDDNSDPQRLAKLDAATRDRLTAKYATMRTLLTGRPAAH